MFIVPEEWLNSDVVISYKMIITDPKGNQGMFNAAGRLIKIFDTSIILRVDQGEVCVPKENIHHMLKISALTLANKIPG